MLILDVFFRLSFTWSPFTLFVVAQAHSLPSLCLLVCSGHWPPQRGIVQHNFLAASKISLQLWTALCLLVDRLAIAFIWNVRSSLLFVCPVCRFSIIGFCSVGEAVAQSRVRVGAFVLVGQTSGMQLLLQTWGFRDLMGKCLYAAHTIWSSFLYTASGLQSCPFQ